MSKLPKVSGPVTAWFLREFDTVNHQHALSVLRVVNRERVVSKSIHEAVQLSVIEINRSLNVLNPNEIVDTIVYLGSLPAIFTRDVLSEIDQIVYRGLGLVDKLSGRSLSLLIWAVCRKLRHEKSRDYLKRVCVFDGFVLRDLVMLISVAADWGEVGLFEKLVLELPSKKFTNLQDIAMLISACARVGGVHVASELVSRLVHDLHIHLKTCGGPISKKSILPIVWGLGELGYRSQPVLIEVYKRVPFDQLDENQTAFIYYMYAKHSGIRDSEITFGFLKKLSIKGLSDRNLANLVPLLTLEDWPLFAEELHIRKSRLSIENLLRMDSDHCMDELVTRIPQMTFSELVLFNSRCELSSVCENALVSEFKAKTLMNGPDLFLLGTTIRKRSHGANLKSRYSKIMQIGIENRVFKTQQVLSNLSLLNDLKIWQKLNFGTQISLYKKATSEQKVGLLPPTDPLDKLSPEYKSRILDTSKRLLKICKVEKKIEKISPKNEFIETENSNAANEFIKTVEKLNHICVYVWCFACVCVVDV